MKNLIYSSNLIVLSQLIQKYGSDSSVVLHHNLAGALECFKESSFDNIAISLDSNEKVELAHLNNLYNVLKSGGSLEITSTNGISDSIVDLVSISGFKAEGKNGSNQLLAKKPDWAGKGVASLKNRKPNGVGAETEVKKTEERIIVESKPVNPFEKISLSTKAEMVDEDALLNEEDNYKKLEQPGDCSTKPKACSDCSCGRAEAEKNGVTLEEKLDNIEKGNISSGCGNCYLGDAFRCGGCPYKGLPAFKPGDKIKLDLSKGDVGGILNENSEIKVSNGKVKLAI